MIQQGRLFFFAFVLLTALSLPARADFAFDFGQVFSGTAPTGTAPWLTADFHTVAPGNVTLTLTSHFHSASEFLSAVYFNTNPALGLPNSLSVLRLSGVAPASINKDEDNYKAGPDGLYDLLFSFPTANQSRFGAGSTAVFQLTLSGLTEHSFHFWSTPAGGAGPFIAAAHIQGIAGANGGTTGAWVTGVEDIVPSVPEPAGILMLLTAVSGVALLRRRY